MTTICAYVLPPYHTRPAHICKELADGFWKGTSYCIVHLELVALGKG